MEGLDLAGYLVRIGYAGPREPTLKTLREVHRLHPAHIAFENLDVLLGRPIRLDAAALYRKLVAGRRGGYCFEHNTLLLHALTALGFRAAPLLARVLWQRDPQRPVPRTHMLLRIDLADGIHLADVGFGACTPTAPLRLAPELVQETPLEPFRLLRRGAEYDLQVRLPEGWTEVYRFHPDPVLPVDCDPPNWFHSTCPMSPFTQRLVAGRADGGRRHLLRDNIYSERYPDQPGTQRIVPSGAELVRLLETIFMIAFDDAAEREAMRLRLDRFCVPTAD